MIFTDSNWVSTRWLWSVNLQNNRKETAIYKGKIIHKTIKNTEYIKQKTNIQNNNRVIKNIKKHVR
jgi:hypothetical protein